MMKIWNVSEVSHCILIDLTLIKLSAKVLIHKGIDLLRTQNYIIFEGELLISQSLLTRNISKVLHESQNAKN